MDYIDSIAQYDEVTQSDIKTFLDYMDPIGAEDPARIDHETRETAFNALKGQAVTEELFCTYNLVHYDSQDNPNKQHRLEEEQHPPFAYSGGSNPYGHEMFFVGQNMVGMTLVLRLPASEWFDSKGLMLPEVETFITLAQSKHIGHIIHSKNDSSLMLDIAYRYHNAGVSQGKPLPDDLQDVPQILIDYAKQCQPLYDAVVRHGFKYYEERGISFKGVQTDAEKFKIALGIEALERDVREFKKYPDAKPVIVPVFQCDANRKHYIYLEDEGRYVPVPLQKGNPQTIQKEVGAFLEALPDSDKIPNGKNTYQEVAYAIAVGYTRYVEKAEKESGELKQGSSSCTDARTPPRVLIGRSKSERTDVYVLRAPGISFFERFVDGVAVASETAKRFLAIAKYLGIKVVHAHHTVCGAMTAVDDDLSGKNPSLPAAFQDLAAARIETYAEILTRGTTQAERCAAYVKETGIPVQNDADCLAVQQLLFDIEAAKNYPDGARVRALFHDTSGRQLYMERENRKAGETRFVTVPLIEGLVELPDRPGVSLPSKSLPVSKAAYQL